MSIAAVPALTDNYILSEGPVWDAASGKVSWVDLEAGSILSAPVSVDAGGAPRIGAISRVDVGEYAGCAFPLDGGRILVALTRRLAIVEVDGSLTRGSELLPEGTRFNDGKIDPAGRLVVGSLSLGEGRGDTNVLLRLEFDGTITTLDDDLGLSNGLGWSPDGTVFYSTDTESRVIYRRDYDATSGDVGQRSVFLSFDGQPEGAEYPDGLTVDADGNLWVAFWGGSGVTVFAPDGSRRDDLGISIDAPHSSSVAFIGDDLDIAVVTSASRDLSAPEREQYPNAGGLFVAVPGARGQLATPWREVALP